MSKETDLTSFIWNNANLLWGDFQHIDMGRIILPFTVLRRLECVLESSREQVHQTYLRFKDTPNFRIDAVLRNASGRPFYNTSQFSLATLGGTQTLLNLQNYLEYFSENIRTIFEQFGFHQIIERLDKAKLLFQLCQNFANIDLHPDAVSDRSMSNVYEHLIARYGSEVGTGAEDFMTPKDVVHLATTMLLAPDNTLFANEKGIIRTLYDQTCGTGGFLTDMINYIDTFKDTYGSAPLLLPYGQELQPETHAVALGNILLKSVEGQEGRDLSEHIKLGSTLSEDAFLGKHFHYQCSNPPFGKNWSKDATAVQKEHKDPNGRFSAGLPSIDDGSMLFLQNLVAKFEKVENGGGRGAIVLSGSPLFNGKAGSGQSEIRRWILENDYLEAIIALPTDIFFRTGIGTYLWLLSNRKPSHRKGKVQLIDATQLGSSMRKNESKKSKFISDDTIAHLTQIYTDFEQNDISKIFDYREFGYRQVKVQRPLRVDFVKNTEKMTAFWADKAVLKMKESDQTALKQALETLSERTHSDEFIAWLNALPFKLTKAVKNALLTLAEPNPDAEPLTIDGEMQFDKTLADEEIVPLLQEVEDYFTREVLPHQPDAVLDQSVRDEKDQQLGIVGYEINFNRYFYQFEQPRHPEAVLADIQALSKEVSALLATI